MQTIHAPVLMEKEAIPTLRFPESDVLSSPEKRKQRLTDLRNANELGDLAQYKVKIHFMDEEGLKKVVTTVWKADRNTVVLKYGVCIPTNRIIRVVFP